MFRFAPDAAVAKINGDDVNMRAAEIYEKWDQTIVAKTSTAGGSSGMSVDVFRNPSRTLFCKMIKNHHELRALITKNDDLLIWDAAIAIHDDVEQHYDVHNCWLVLTKDDVLMRHLEYWTDDGVIYDGSLLHLIRVVRDNINLRRLYGNFTLVGENTFTDEYPLLNTNWITKHIQVGNL